MGKITIINTMVMLFLCLALILSHEVIIQPYSVNGEEKFLTNNLKIEKSSLDDSGVYWSLHSNQKNEYRISRFRHWIDISKKDSTLIKKDGGDALEKFNEDEKMREIKRYLDKENKKSSNMDSTEDNDEIEEKAIGKIESESSLNKGKPKKEIRDPIIDKSSGLTGDYFDSLTPEFLSHLTESGIYDIGAEFGKKQASKLKENNEDDNKKEILPDAKPKIEINKQNALSNKHNMKSNLTGDKNKAKSKLTESAKSETDTSSNITGSRRTGFVFQLFPIFIHKLNKKTLIIINEKCLTHSLKFKNCSFDNYWNLGDEFYWNVYKAENIGFLDGLKKMIGEKEKSNIDVKKNQFAKTENCPNACPDGDCQSNDDDSNGYNEGDSTVQNLQSIPNSVQQPAPNPQTMSRNAPFTINTTFPSGNPTIATTPVLSKPRKLNNGPKKNTINFTDDLMKKLYEASLK